MPGAPRAPGQAQRATAPRLPWRLPTWLGLAIVLAAGALVHWPALRTFFAQDDVTFLARAMGLEPIPWSLARPLYEGFTWRALYALFGLHPFPYHLVNLLLHLVNATLVFAVALRLRLSRGAALAAALLFGVTPIAFTPTHWAAGILEIQVTLLALAAFWLWLVARERGSMPLLWAAALVGLAAALSKENAVLLPLVLAVANARAAPPPRPWRMLVPQGVLSLLFAIAFAATLRSVHFAGSEAYARNFSPGFLAANLATYLRWIVRPYEPVPDFVAAADPAALTAGVLVGLAGLAFLWVARHGDHHPEQVGAAWFIAMLAPVVPLDHRTYIYYLYLPWAGACWFLAALGARVTGRWPATTWVAAAGLVAFAWMGFASVRARESAMVRGFPADKVVRESRLLSQCLEQLRALQLPPGARVAFVNPAPRRHFSLAGGDTAFSDRPTGKHSYVPLEGALRGGEALRVFAPGIGYAGFGETVPTAWEDAHILLFNDQARLMDVGTGSAALSELGTMCLQIHEWAKADSFFLRTRVRGDTLPDATFGLVITSDFLGRKAESDRYAHEFMRRWPLDFRAAYLDSVLRANAGVARDR